VQNEYNILTNITFRHRYFSNQKLECLSVHPSQGAEKTMLNEGLMFKPFIDGFVLLYETSFDQPRARKDALKNGEPLRFYVTLKDSNFFNYTEGGMENLAGSVYAFRNNRANEDALVLADQLHREEFVSKEDVVLCKDLDEQFFSKPFALLDVYLTENLKTEYTITFKEKQTYWRYILVSDHLKCLKQPAILGDQETFKGPFEMRLPDKRNVLYFVSEKPISLSQATLKHFKLVENYENELLAQRVVKRLLPVPDTSTISAFGNANPNDKNYYSEIYIY